MFDSNSQYVNIDYTNAPLAQLDRATDKKNTEILDILNKFS